MSAEVIGTYINGVYEITFTNAPHNALTGQMLEQLVKEIELGSGDPEVKVILLQSGGDRTFCAGASIDEMKTIQNLDSAERFFSGFGHVMSAIVNAQKFVVCKVQGKLVGGGLGLVAASDYVIATKWASIRLSELSIGIGPFVIEPFITSKIGLGNFQKLAYNPEEWQTANWAHEKGLFQEVFEDNDQMREYAEFYCNRLIAYRPESMQKLKSIRWQNIDLAKLLSDRARLSGELLITKGQ